MKPDPRVARNHVPDPKTVPVLVYHVPDPKTVPVLVYLVTLNAKSNDWP